MSKYITYSIADFFNKSEKSAKQDLKTLEVLLEAILSIIM